MRQFRRFCVAGTQLFATYLGVVSFMSALDANEYVLAQVSLAIVLLAGPLAIINAVFWVDGIHG